MAMSIRTDEAIQADVQEALQWDAHVRPSDIGVVVTDGIVTLTGWVDAYLKKMAAREAAHRVRGVKAVANDIEVRLPGSAERTDTDLAKAVLGALQWDAAIPAGKVEVTVSQGWVTLGGEVDHAFQVRDAEHAVRRHAGVKGVSNLIVVNRSRVLPTDLKQQIERALLRNAQTDASRITVEMEGGQVILRGTVRSSAEKQAAEETAWSAPGVSEVENRIVIEPIL